MQSADSVAKRVEKGVFSVQLGLLINLLLAVTKILAGIVGNSYALIADGVESAADIFSSIVVIRGLRISERAATEEYHFGFGKAESLAATFVALMLLTAAVGIAIAGVREILTPHHLPAMFTLYVLVGVVLLKEGLYRYSYDVGSQVESTAVKSDAWHHRSDALTSIAAFVGISIALWGGEGWESADDYAALVAAGVIAFNGVRLLRESLADLMDRAPSGETLQQISEAASAVQGVAAVEKLLVRKAGLGIFLEMHVHADPEMTLQQAHVLSGIVKRSVREKVPQVIGAVIHMEPYESAPQSK